MKAIRNGITAIFSDKDWKTGQPQRYGWQEEGKEGKTLPKEIVAFIERRKAPEIKQEIKEPIPPLVIDVIKTNPVKVVKAEKVVTTTGGKKKSNEQTIQIDTKIKTKKNDNPKQKGRPSGKRNAGTVGKA